MNRKYDPETSDSMPCRPNAAVRAAVEAACGRIAPTWPLDQAIAVNPLWGFVDRPLPEVAARVADLAGHRLLMPRAWFRERFQRGLLSVRHLEAAIERSGAPLDVATLLDLFDAPEPEPQARALVADCADAERDLGHSVSWREHVIQTTSRFLAAWFDEGQAALPPDREGGLHRAWHAHIVRDAGTAVLSGHRLRREVLGEPADDPLESIGRAVRALEIAPDALEGYFTALLLRLGGWAAWCAGERWRARLRGEEDRTLVDLLAILVDWEWLLLESAGPADLRERWRAVMAGWPYGSDGAHRPQGAEWLLQLAIEIAWQDEMCAALETALISSPRVADAPDDPMVEAVFCIDVRSEVFRRALEGASPRVHTRGFAGFFGLPIDHVARDSDRAQPQLPGLLAPRFRAVDEPGPTPGPRPRLGATLARLCKAIAGSPTGAFTYVETAGPLYAFGLLRDTFGRGRQSTAQAHTRARPELRSHRNGEPVTPQDRIDLAEGLLRGIGLTGRFPRLVLFVGHAAYTVNNPFAASLQCGACGGQSGAVNARVAASLLEDPSTRAGLRLRGIDIPGDTRFLAGVHDTTVDSVELFDLDTLPPSHSHEVEALQAWLREAGNRSRAERAARLGLDATDPARLHAAMASRAHDWAQVRPEWGLVDNAALVIAPRERTRSIDLGGRVFLHEYRWQDDPDQALLGAIAAGPLIVAHWINFQYYASTVDHRHFGAGDKVLHDVVGGHIGVFEGNGGDLRIGLPLQSLHDGRDWVHTPLRLSVFIEAPAEAVEAVLARNPQVRELVENEWIWLFRIDPRARAVVPFRNGRWVLDPRQPARVAAAALRKEPARVPAL